MRVVGRVRMEGVECKVLGSRDGTEEGSGRRLTCGYRCEGVRWRWWG